MAKTYMEEYTDFINGIQNRLLNIQFRFNGILAEVNDAVDSRVITEELGKKLLNARMDRFIPNVDHKYVLPKADTDFVAEYAALDEHGQLLSSMIKDEFLDKANRIKTIYDSIKVYSYLDSLGKKDARLFVKIVLYKYYSKEVSAIEDKLINLVTIYGENEKHSSKYQKLVAEKEKIKKALRLIAQLENTSDEVFEKIVSQFYGVKKNYYDWFLQMQIKQEYEEGTIYEENCSLMNSMSSDSKKVLSASDEVALLTRSLEDNNKALFSVLNDLASFKVEDVLGVSEKPKKFFFQKALITDNKEDLFKLFFSLVGFFGVNKYIEDTYSNGNNSIGLKTAFDSYFIKTYGTDISYVEPSKFISDLRNTIVGYYQNNIEGLMYKIGALNVKINSNASRLCGSINTGVQNANLMKRIRDEYPAKKDQLVLSGFTMDELERIYKDLKEFIGAGYGFCADSVKVFLRKV
jgi:hypothetical protein